MNLEGLTLRALEPEDIDVLYQWENDMEMWVVSNTLTPFSRYQLKKHIEQAQLDVFQTKQLRLIIEIPGTNEPLGMVDLFDFDVYHQRAGVGILVHQSHRGKGIAKEALTLFSDYCFNTLGLHQLYANIGADNLASQRLFESCGFVLAGIKKDWLKSGRSFTDVMLYQRIHNSK